MLGIPGPRGRNLLGRLFNGLRKATVDFFEQVEDKDMEQMTKITATKP